MKIHQDGLVATATPSRKAVSFRDADSLRHSGRAPFQENTNRTPMKSPYFKSPASTNKTTSNSLRQGLKKGCTPSSTKSKGKITTDQGKENNVETKRQPWKMEYNFNEKPKSKTPNSASALRRTLRSTMQPQQKQQPSMTISEQSKKVSLKTSSNVSSDNGPFQSLTTVTSSYATLSLLGRSRLLGKGGVAPGKSIKSSLGPAARVVPKTPNTLLRDELEDEDDFDESFLLSPPPGALWNALNLNSGGDKEHTISPTVTTGLIVVSPQAADQIHTWSSTKKRLNSTPPEMSDKVSPAVPRALMQTPCIELDKTTSPMVEEHTDDIETTTIEDIGDSTVNERTSMVPKSTEKDIENSVEKSTKGGVSMDMTGFFSLQDDDGQTQQSQKKWVKSESLSAKMPVALLSRLNSNRPTSSKKKTKTIENKSSPTVSKATSSKTKATSTDSKLPTRRPVSSSWTNKTKTKFTSSNFAKKNAKVVDDAKQKKAVEDTKSRAPKNIIPAKSQPSNETRKQPLAKPWKRQAPKSNSAVDKIEAARVTDRKRAKDDEKPWKRHAAQRQTASKVGKNTKTNLSTKTLGREETSKEKDSARNGGLAFDIGFGDVDSIRMPLKNKTNQTQLSTNSSAKTKKKESSNTQNWADKQSGVFVGWLNYTLIPEELDVNGDCVASGLRALIVHRRLAEGRINALNLFKGDSMFNIRTIIAKEISRGKLSIRADRDVTVDVHLRKKLTSLLLSYTTPWLRLALEVMSGECIEPVPISESGPQSYLGRMKLSLEQFIKRRFLSDDNTLQKFTRGKCSVPSGAFETRYKAQMRNLVLSRVMILVFFLDRAKASNVLENVPRLFTISSNVKSTRDVLVTICRECLSAEGDIVKHLSRIGLKISYVQDPIDEVNFRVTNLATDLRDGVILTRLSEIMTSTPFKKSMSSLRLPAVSRLQKKFNVNLAFSAIKDFGITIADGINAHHIMDGHREMVLALMWCIIAQCSLEKLIQRDQVEQEIHNVIQSSQARKKLDQRSFTVLTPTVKSTLGKNASTEEMLKDLLLRWSHAVCSSFGLAITDLSESFADGKALCLLVHYYHPSLINLDEVLPRHESESDDKILESERQNWKKASKSMQELGGIPDMLPICDSKNPPNERSMILCLSYLCSRLMESSREIFATILIQACYRKYRRKVLMEKKIAAASTIFRIWTVYRENYFRHQEQRFKESVAVLENFVLSHKHSLKRLKKERLKRELLARSAIDIQRVFRGWLGRCEFDHLWSRQMAANIIQRTFRRYCAIRTKEELSNRRDSAIVIQSAFRGYIAHEKFLDYRYFIIEMQRHVRGYLTRKDLKAQDYAALVIQQAWWSYMTRVEMNAAATLLQKAWRGVLGRRKSLEQQNRHNAASSIQKLWKGYHQAKVYSITIQSTILIQKMARGFLGRKLYSVNRSRHAATCIQKVWRGFSVQVQYQMDMLDIVCVQSIARTFLAKRERERRSKALSVIQCAYRCALARREMHTKVQTRMMDELRHQSAVVIQRNVRTFVVRQNIFRLQCAAYVIQSQWRELLLHRSMVSASMKIQSMFRGRQCRKKLLELKVAAIELQRHWRGFSSRQTLEISSYAATIIQSSWRRYWIHIDYTLYLSEKKSATLIQAQARRMLTMRMIGRQNMLARRIQCCWSKYKLFKAETNAATKMQSIVRCSKARSQFNEMKRSAITLQRIWRGFSVQVQYQIDILDIVCVQSVVRRYLVSKAAQRSVSAASTIQRAVRCAAARRERNFRKLVLDSLVHESSIKIQSAIRGHVSRSKFLRMKSASLVMQKCWRGYCDRKFLAYLAQNAAVIQSTWRMHQERKRYISFLIASTKIQACFRMHSIQSKYLAMKESATSIQRCWRGCCARDHLLRQHLASTIIQSHWRRCVAQNNYLLDLLEIKSATLIQASFRMYMHREDYMVIRYSAQTIQRFTRGLLTRVDLAVKHFAASEIQRIWRGHSTCSSKSMIHGLVKIQSFTRMVVAKEKARTLRILRLAETFRLNRSALIIQTSFRNFALQKKRESASRIIQKAYRFHAGNRRNRAASRGVIALQARFRGGKVRKYRSKRVRQLAEQIKKETKRALRDPTLRLGYRTSQALEILQTSQSLTKIMDAVKELEASTRLSVVCCQVFTKVNAANILLYLIQSCNRSVPHMELKEHILLTLENVAQYPSLVGSFAHYKYAEVFLDNVQVFRDKDGIFCLAVLLLARITKADPNVAQFCATHEHLKRLREVHRVVSRKRSKSKKSQVLSEKVRRLRKCGLAKRDDFDRAASTRLLKEMIDAFSQIEVPHILPTPNATKKFNWNELQYSPLI